MKQTKTLIIGAMGIPASGKCSFLIFLRECFIEHYGRDVMIESVFSGGEDIFTYVTRDLYSTIQMVDGGAAIIAAQTPKVIFYSPIKDKQDAENIIKFKGLVYFLTFNANHNPQNSWMYDVKGVCPIDSSVSLKRLAYAAKDEFYRLKSTSKLKEFFGE